MMNMEAGSECIANIGTRERQMRLTFGVALLALGAGVAAALVATDVPRLWRVAVFLPLWAGAVGVFQAKGKT